MEWTKHIKAIYKKHKYYECDAEEDLFGCGTGEFYITFEDKTLHGSFKVVHNDCYDIVCMMYPLVENRQQFWHNMRRISFPPSKQFYFENDFPKYYLESPKSSDENKRRIERICTDIFSNRNPWK